MLLWADFLRRFSRQDFFHLKVLFIVQWTSKKEYKKYIYTPESLLSTTLRSAYHFFIVWLGVYVCKQTFRELRQVFTLDSNIMV